MLVVLEDAMFVVGGEHGAAGDDAVGAERSGEEIVRE